MEQIFQILEQDIPYNKARYELHNSLGGFILELVNIRRDIADPLKYNQLIDKLKLIMIYQKIHKTPDMIYQLKKLYENERMIEERMKEIEEREKEMKNNELKDIIKKSGFVNIDFRAATNKDDDSSDDGSIYISDIDHIDLDQEKYIENMKKCYDNIDNLSGLHCRIKIVRKYKADHNAED